MKQSNKSPKAASVSSRLNAAGRISFMRLNPEKMYNDFYIAQPIAPVASKYFNPRHFQIQSFMERCDMVIIVEHCSLCETHTHLLRHDGRKYEYEANKCLSQLSRLIHEGGFPLRLGVVKVPVLPLDYTVGCFEVSLIYQNRAGEYYNKLVFSKRVQKHWPSTEELEAKLQEFIRNAKMRTARPADNLSSQKYAGECVGGILPTPYPVGGFGPWESTAYGRANNVVYPAVHSQTLLAALITTNDVLWVFDSRLDESVADVMSPGTVVWVRNVSSVSVEADSNERHAQIGVIVAPPSQQQIPKTRSSSPTNAGSGTGPTAAPTTVTLRLKYDTQTQTVPVALCMNDSEHIYRRPLHLDYVPLELECVCVLAYLYADRLPRNDALVPVINNIKASMSPSANPTQVNDIDCIYIGWQMASNNNNDNNNNRDNVSNKSVQLSRMSVYRGLKVLVSRLEQLLQQEGKISAQNNYCVCHRNTQQRIDLQLVYSEPVLDWIFSKFGKDTGGGGGKIGNACVNVIELQQYVLSNYQQQKQQPQQLQNVVAAATPAAHHNRSSGESPVCGISDPATAGNVDNNDESSVTGAEHFARLRLDIGACVRKHCETYTASVFPAYAAELAAELSSKEDNANILKQIQLIAPAFHYVLTHLCVDMYLDTRPQQQEQQQYGPELLRHLHTSGELQSSLMCLEHWILSQSQVGQPMVSAVEMDKEVLFKFINLLLPSGAGQGAPRRVFELLQCCIDVQGLGYIRIIDLSTALANNYFGTTEGGDSVGALWHTLNIQLQSNAQDLIGALVSEGVSAYLRNTPADDSGNIVIPDGWLCQNTHAHIPSDAFVMCLQRQQQVLSPLQMEVLVRVFESVHNVVTFEALNLDDEGESGMDATVTASAQKKSQKKGQSQKLLSSKLSSTQQQQLLPPHIKTGSSDVTLIQWYFFLRWLLLSGYSHSTSNDEDTASLHSAKGSELDALITQLALQYTSRGGLTPLQSVGTPMTGRRRPYHLTPHHHHQYQQYRADSPLMQQNVDDSSMCYTNEWDTESNHHPHDRDEGGGGGFIDLAHQEHLAHLRQQHHEHGHGHSGYSNYEGSSIANDDSIINDGAAEVSSPYGGDEFYFEATDAGEFAQTYSQTYSHIHSDTHAQAHGYSKSSRRAAGSPGSAAPVIASLEDLIMTIDDHVAQELERQSMTKDILARCVSAHAGGGSVSGGSVNSKLQLQQQSRAKSASNTPNNKRNNASADAGSRRASVSGGSRPHSSRPGSTPGGGGSGRVYPKELTLTRMEIYGAPLRGIVEAHAQSSPDFAITASIVTEAVTLEGKVTFNNNNGGKTSGSPTMAATAADSSILSFNLQHQAAGNESSRRRRQDDDYDDNNANANVEAKKLPGLDLRQVPNIQILIKAVNVRRPKASKPVVAAAVTTSTPAKAEASPLPRAPTSQSDCEAITSVPSTSTKPAGSSSNREEDKSELRTGQNQESDADQLLLESILAEDSTEIFGSDTQTPLGNSKGAKGSINSRNDSSKSLDDFINDATNTSGKAAPASPLMINDGVDDVVTESTAVPATTVSTEATGGVAGLLDASPPEHAALATSTGNWSPVGFVDPVPTSGPAAAPASVSVTSAPVEVSPATTAPTPAPIQYETIPMQELFQPIYLSTKRFLDVQDSEFRLDFDIVPILVNSSHNEGNNGTTIAGELETIHVSIFGEARDFESLARHRWSEARTPHYALMARLPPNVNSIIHPNSAKHRVTTSHSLLTPWFPAATNNQREPGKASLAEHRPMSPTWYPTAINNRDPFTDGRVWNYSQEMRLRQLHLKQQQQQQRQWQQSPLQERRFTIQQLEHALKSPPKSLLSPSPKPASSSSKRTASPAFGSNSKQPQQSGAEVAFDNVDLDAIGMHSYSLLKDEEPIRPISSGKNSMQSAFFARNKYSGGVSRPIPPQPDKKPPVPHFDFVKPIKERTKPLFMDIPVEEFVPPPRRAATPKSSDFPKLKFGAGDNLSDGPYYAHRTNRFPTEQPPYTAILGSALPRWPEVKQGTGNMPRPRVLPPNIKLRDSPSHYKLYKYDNYTAASFD